MCTGFCSAPGSDQLKAVINSANSALKTLSSGYLTLHKAEKKICDMSIKPIMDVKARYVSIPYES